MIAIRQLLRESVEGIIILYHGTNEANRLDSGLQFFSTDKEFSLNFGSYLWECKVNLGRVFDSMQLLDIQKLYDYGFKITDPYYMEREDKDNIHYDYENDNYPTAADFIKGCSNNSWEAIEKTAGVIRWIFSNGFNSIRLYEEGIVNYFCDISRVMEKKLIRGKIKESEVIKESPDNVLLPKLYTHLSYIDNSAIPFGFFEDKLYIGRKKTAHWEISDEYPELAERLLKRGSDDLDYLDRDDYWLCGRLWSEERVISFWLFPSREELIEFINKWNMENEHNKGIKLDGSWYVEVPGNTSSELVRVEDYVEPGVSTWNEAYKKYREKKAEYASQMAEGIIKEDPDTVYIPKEHIHLSTTDDDAIPFGISQGLLYIGNIGDWHSNMLKRYNISQDADDYDMDFELAGRLWKDTKVITFWEFPNRNALNGIINVWNKDKRYNFGIIIDNNWYIEVPDEESSYSKLVHIKDYIKPNYEGWEDFNSSSKPATGDYSSRAMGFHESIINKLRLIGESPDSIRLVGQNVESSWRDMFSYPFAYGEDGKMWIGRERGWHNDEDHKFNKEISTTHEYLAGRVFGQDRTISFWFFPSKMELNKIINDFNKEAKVKELPFRIDGSWYVELPKDEYGSYSKLVSVGDYEPPIDFSSWMERLKMKVGNNFGTGDE